MHVSTLELADPAVYPKPDIDKAGWWDRPAALLLSAVFCAAVAALATRGLVAVPAALSAALP